MKCLIANPNIKTFSKLIQTFNKIGDEVFIETLVNGIAFKIINSSRSAYFSVILYSAYFQKFDPYEPTKRKELTPPCKLTCRALIQIFRSLSNYDKLNVDYIKLTLNTDLNKAIVKLFCKHDIIKTYNLFYVECEPLEAIVPDDLLNDSQEDPTEDESQQRTSYVAKIVCPAKTLLDLTAHFTAVVEEITIQFNQTVFNLKNYVNQSNNFIGPEYDNNNTMNPKNKFTKNRMNHIFEDDSSLESCKNAYIDTRIKYDPSNFSQYTFKGITPILPFKTGCSRSFFMSQFTPIEDISSRRERISQNRHLDDEFIELTFCIQELKAALAFFDHLDGRETDICVRLDCPGKPLFITSQIAEYFQAQFLLSTLAEMVLDDNDYESQEETAVVEQNTVNTPLTELDCSDILTVKPKRPKTNKHKSPPTNQSTKVNTDFGIELSQDFYQSDDDMIYESRRNLLNEFNSKNHDSSKENSNTNPTSKYFNEPKCRQTNYLLNNFKDNSMSKPSQQNQIISLKSVTSLNNKSHNNAIILASDSD